MIRTSITNKKIIGLFREIATNYHISFEDLKSNYYHRIFKEKKKRKKTILKPHEQCMARKQDGFQCSRRRKSDTDYCGKHIKKRQYGRIDNTEQQTINVKNIVINDNEYLIDNDNIIYNLSKTIILGKLMDNGEIFHINTSF